MCTKSYVRLYGSWAIVRDRQTAMDGRITFYPPNNLENQNFEKMKKEAGYIVLHMCTINENHMMYGSWVTYGVQQTQFVLILDLFLPFYPKNHKNQNFGKMKNNCWRYHHFTHEYQKLWLDDVQFLRYGTWRTGKKSDI